MGWLIALGVIGALAVLPVGVIAKYDLDGPAARLLIGPLGIKLFPKEKSNKQAKKCADRKRSETKKINAGGGHAGDAKGGSWKDFLPLVNICVDFLKDFHNKIRVKKLELKLILADDDPCDLAVNYGRAWAVLGSLFPLFESLFVIKKRNVEVECDFTATDTTVIAKLHLSMMLGRFLYIVARHGARALFTYIKINNKRKGGAEL